MGLHWTWIINKLCSNPYCPLATTSHTYLPNISSAHHFSPEIHLSGQSFTNLWIFIQKLLKKQALVVSQTLWSGEDHMYMWINTSVILFPFLIWTHISWVSKSSQRASIGRLTALQHHFLFLMGALWVLLFSKQNVQSKVLNKYSLTYLKNLLPKFKHFETIS
jgi:hypothetical protein